MKIVLHGDMTPKQLGNAVSEIIENTVKKMEAQGKRYVIHDPNVTLSLNIKDQEDPVVIFDDEQECIFTIHSGVEKGELVKYTPPTYDESLEQFHAILDSTEPDPEEGVKE